MTSNLNEYYGVTVIHPKKVGPRLWSAEGIIFRRDRKKCGHRVSGEGGRETAAMSRALEEARAVVFSLGRPDDWDEAVSGSGNLGF